MKTVNLHVHMNLFNGEGFFGIPPPMILIRM